MWVILLQTTKSQRYVFKDFFFLIVSMIQGIENLRMERFLAGKLIYNFLFYFKSVGARTFLPIALL